MATGMALFTQLTYKCVLIRIAMPCTANTQLCIDRYGLLLHGVSKNHAFEWWAPSHLELGQDNQIRSSQPIDRPNPFVVSLSTLNTKIINKQFTPLRSIQLFYVYES